MKETTEQKYKIQFVAKVTGINPHTIRAWEKRYQAVIPLRDDTGRRVYSEKEISRLDLLKRLVSAGNDISDIANLEDQKLQAIMEQYYPHEALAINSKNSFNSEFDHSRSLQNLHFGLQNFKLDIVSHELKKANESLSASDFVLKIIGPFLQSIKTLKENKELADFQKTSLFAIIKLELFQKLLHISGPRLQNEPLLIFSPEGALNELCSLSYALLALDAKLPFYYLGANMTAEAASEVIKQLKPPMVIVPFAHCHAGLNVGNFIRDLELKLEGKTKVIIGHHCAQVEQISSNISSFKTFQELYDLLEQKKGLGLVH
jgi:MerR family transcriptional regulator, light-induced transcriptional regulator